MPLSRFPFQEFSAYLFTKFIEEEIVPCYLFVIIWFILLHCRGAALPTNTPGIPCIFDPRGRAGICGDWLLGSSLEAAALSGIALADQVILLNFIFLSPYYWLTANYDKIYKLKPE